ncbi:hypothetical protein TrLO_g3618 [Triparma laevis f. longispina]|uniref:Uncharacterized protein n=1 Tax=Triparma laevis f. longispina TaxID=1714387 RepID=A0A9W7F310_9STRA|nr:hypothetical protein TrLO_g3618 [Triparma laevis f. longispina]
MPPRARKKRKGNEEGGGVGDDVATFSDEVKVENLVAVKQEQEGNPKENSVEEIQQVEESSMSMLLKEVRSMREEMKEMKGLQERAREETKAGKEEMLNRSEETGAKMESVFEELISIKDELREARKEGIRGAETTLQISQQRRVEGGG